MLAVIEIPAAVYVIWWVMLIAAVVIVLPLVVWLLNRVLTAARNIKGYTATTLEAGVGIVENTVATTALQETIALAGEMLQTAKSIEERTAIIQQVLTQRAGGVGVGGNASTVDEASE